MKPIYLLCLHNVRTGGPEAIHQLSDALIEQGFDARMVYYDWAQIAAMELAEPQDGYHFGARANPIEEYERYKVNVTDHVPNAQDMVVVLPETLCHLAPKFDKATVLIWWLSVDNGFGALARVNLDHLRKPNVWHAGQSDYALDLLQALRLRDVRSRRLTDYTTDLPADGALPMLQRPLLVAIQATPHKVAVDVDAIAQRLGNAGIESRLIGRASMTREDLVRLFWTARVYLDLGNMPGNDRMPREARMLGCQVLTKDNLYHWWDADGVAEMVAEAVRDPDPEIRAHKRAAFNQGGMTLHEAERHDFFREVREVFSAL